MLPKGRRDGGFRLGWRIAPHLEAYLPGRIREQRAGWTPLRKVRELAKRRATKTE